MPGRRNTNSSQVQDAVVSLVAINNKDLCSWSKPHLAYPEFGCTKRMKHP